MSRATLLHQADAILKSTPEPESPAVRVRYRGGRPAMNWLAKKSPEGAACLWRIARERIPSAANDNAQAEGLSVDRRPSGKPRGRGFPPMSVDAYLARPGVQPRLGDADRQPPALRGWFSWFEIKPQRDVFGFHPNCRFGFCAPAMAHGAIFLGAEGGLGQTKMGKQRGDVRRVDGPDLPKPSEEADIVIETMLSGGNVADIGRALGAKGGHADRRGGKALLAAGEWAKAALAA